MYAKRTLQLLLDAVEKDNGVTYRQHFKKHLLASQDVFRGAEGVRTQHGASGIGRPCLREQWLKFRWAGEETFEPRVLLLFHRGHLEEPRLLALLSAAGFTVYDTDAQGKQYGFSVWGGHYRSRTDGIVVGIPEVPGKPCILEFKTHSEKSFNELQSNGVFDAKIEHYDQVQTSMHNMGIEHTLYLAVCKNTDRLYAEIITYDQQRARMLQSKASQVVFNHTAPPRLSTTASWWQCRNCVFVAQCYRNEPPAVNCRTCTHARTFEDGSWGCEKKRVILTVEAQLAACTEYERNATIDD